MSSMFQLSINLKKGIVVGKSFTSDTHVEMWIDDKLTTTTPCVAAPPVWNHEMVTEFTNLEPSTPIIIGFSVYRKRWMKEGHKLVGSYRFPLSDLIEKVGKGPVTKCVSLNINRKGLQLCGTLHLVYVLDIKEVSRSPRSSFSSLTSEGSTIVASWESLDATIAERATINSSVASSQSPKASQLTPVPVLSRQNSPKTLHTPLHHTETKASQLFQQVVHCLDASSKSQHLRCPFSGFSTDNNSAQKVGKKSEQTVVQNHVPLSPLSAVASFSSSSVVPVSSHSISSPSQYTHRRACGLRDNAVTFCLLAALLWYCVEQFHDKVMGRFLACVVFLYALMVQESGHETRVVKN